MNETTDPVAAWLDSIAMGQYAEAFGQNRVGMAHLEGLTDSDLAAMGVAALGDRRTILDGIAALRQEGAHAAEAEEDAARQERARRVDRWCLKAALAVTVLCGLVGMCSSQPGGFFYGALGGVAISLGLYVYSLPAALAFRRGHPYRWAILIANGLLGVTGVVWVILLCYALGLFGSGAALALGYVATRE